MRKFTPAVNHITGQPLVCPHCGKQSKRSPEGKTYKTCDCRHGARGTGRCICQVSLPVVAR